MEAVGGSCDCAFSSSSFDAAIHLGSDRVIFTRSGRSSLEPVWCLPSPFCPAGGPAVVGGGNQYLSAALCGDMPLQEILRKLCSDTMTGV